MMLLSLFCMHNYFPPLSSLLCLSWPWVTSLSIFLCLSPCSVSNKVAGIRRRTKALWEEVQALSNEQCVTRPSTSLEQLALFRMMCSVRSSDFRFDTLNRKKRKIMCPDTKWSNKQHLEPSSEARWSWMKRYENSLIWETHEFHMSAVQRKINKEFRLKMHKMYVIFYTFKGRLHWKAEELLSKMSLFSLTEYRASEQSRFQPGLFPGL